MKIFDSSFTEANSNMEKKVFQDFKVLLKSDQATFKTATNLKLSVSGLEDPQNPKVYPSTLRLKEDKDVPFSIEYNCKKLLDNGGKYYDTIRVLVEDSQSFGKESELVFEYMVVCDKERLTRFDLNFLVLFGIAIGIIVIAIKTPPLLIFKDMTEEEQEQTDLKLSQAVFFFLMSSCMLLVLYLFLD
jgi:hypothetical protein